MRRDIKGLTTPAHPAGAQATSSSYRGSEGSLSCGALHAVGSTSATEVGTVHGVACSAPPVVAGEHTASTRGAYWHGGVPGLKVGEYILPPSVTRTRFTLCAYVGEEESRAGYQRTRVYLTSEREVAEVFAAMRPGGWVYRVVPEGQLEQDPDVAARGMSWACKRARIIEVVPLSEDTVVDILMAIALGSIEDGETEGAA